MSLAAWDENRTEETATVLGTCHTTSDVVSLPPFLGKDPVPSHIRPTVCWVVTDIHHNDVERHDRGAKHEATHLALATNANVDEDEDVMHEDRARERTDRITNDATG